MKTIEELAVEYCSEQPAFVPRDQQAFIAGAKASQEWISVDDELPGDNSIALIKTDKNFLFIAVYISNEWICNDTYFIVNHLGDTVKFWRPIDRR